jgi:hypothetical protein
MAICDGCGMEVGAEHIRARIERLELATRFRPVHIHTLLLGDAPPERAEDYFYASEKEGAELQRTGIFLVYAVECPLEGGDALAAVRKAADNVVKRLKFSYKPKSIVLFTAATSELIGPLSDAGFGDHLILSDGKPFPRLPDLAGMRGGGA